MAIRSSDYTPTEAEVLNTKVDSKIFFIDYNLPLQQLNTEATSPKIEAKKVKAFLYQHKLDIGGFYAVDTFDQKGNAIRETTELSEQILLVDQCPVGGYIVMNSIPNQEHNTWEPAIFQRKDQASYTLISLKDGVVPTTPSAYYAEDPAEIHRLKLKRALGNDINPSSPINMVVQKYADIGDVSGI